MSAWLTVALGAFAAIMTAGTIISAVAFRVIRLMMDTSILKANNLQLAQMRETYVPSMGTTLTGNEISRRIDELRSDASESAASRIRHDQKNLELIQTWIIEIEKIKARLPNG